MAELARKPSLSLLSHPHPMAAHTGATLYGAQPEEMDLEIFSNRDLLSLRNDIQKHNQLMALEVVLFERFLRRVQPAHNSNSNGTGTANATTRKDFSTDDDNNNNATTNTTLEKDLLAQQASSHAQSQQSQAQQQQQQQQQQQAGAANTRRDKKKKGEKTKEVERVLTLTVDQKADIAIKEQDELRKEIQETKEEWEREADNLKAEMEEMEVRVADIKKALYEFRRDIVQQAVNPRTGKIIAEKVLRYYEEKIRFKVSG